MFDCIEQMQRASRLNVNPSWNYRVRLREFNDILMRLGIWMCDTSWRGTWPYPRNEATVSKETVDTNTELECLWNPGFYSLLPNTASKTCNATVSTIWEFRKTVGCIEIFDILAEVFRGNTSSLVPYLFMFISAIDCVMIVTIEENKEREKRKKKGGLRLGLLRADKMAQRVDWRGVWNMLVIHIIGAWDAAPRFSPCYKWQPGWILF